MEEDNELRHDEKYGTFKYTNTFISVQQLGRVVMQSEETRAVACTPFQCSWFEFST